MRSRRRSVAVALVVSLGCGGLAGCRNATTPVEAPSTTGTTAVASSTSTAVASPSNGPTPLHDRLQAAVDGAVGGRPVPVGVVAIDLASGARAEHLAGRQVLSASLYKLFVARELLRRVGAGSLSRTAPAGDGGGRTIDQCLRDMIVVSDDRCGVAGLRIVGRGAQDATLIRLGYPSTKLTSPQRTSAADVALFLQRTRDGTLLGPGGEGASAELFHLLQQQQINDRLPTGLPPGTAIAHKTGDRTGWAHDGGIITTPNGELLLVVMTGPWPAPCCHAEAPGPQERLAFAVIADIGRALYDEMTG